MLRTLLALGRALEGGLEAYVQPATGLLYLWTSTPRARGPASSAISWTRSGAAASSGWGPPASNAPRDRATTRRLAYLLGQAPTRWAEDPHLQPLLRGLLWDPGRPGAGPALLLDLRDYALEGGRRPGGALPGGGGKALGGGTFGPIWSPRTGTPGACPTHGGGPGKGLGRGDAWEGETVLFSLALEGQAPGRDFSPSTGTTCAASWRGEAVPGGGYGPLPRLRPGRGSRGGALLPTSSSKFYITDKKGFAPRSREEAFPRAYAPLPGVLPGAFRWGSASALERLTLRFLGTEALVLPGDGPGARGGLSPPPGEASRPGAGGLSASEAWREVPGAGAGEVGGGGLPGLLPPPPSQVPRQPPRRREVLLEVPLPGGGPLSGHGEAVERASRWRARGLALPLPPGPGQGWSQGAGPP